MRDSRKYVIGVDFGTDSVRAVVVDGFSGEQKSEHFVTYPRWASGLYQDANRQLFRQHPLDYLESFEACVHEVVRKSKCAENIISLSIDATGSTPCPVNQEGVPLALLKSFSDNPDAMFHLWKDHTAIREASELDYGFKHFGITDYTKYQGVYNSEWYWAKVLHTSRADNSIKREAWAWVEHSDWIPAILTGKTSPSRMYRNSCAAGHKALWGREWGGLPDRDCLAAIDPLLVRIAENYAETPFPADYNVGSITPDWAQRLGVPYGTIIGGSSLDAHAGAVGAGIKECTCVVNLGTSAVEMMISKPDLLKDSNLIDYCGQASDSIIPGFLGIEAGQAAFGDVYIWFVNLLMWALQFVEQNEKSTNQSFNEMIRKEIFEKLTEQASANEDVPPIQSLEWFNGRRYPVPDENARGLIAGLSLGTTPPQIFQSLVFSTIFGLKRIILGWEKEGLKIENFISIGGIAGKSPYIIQLLADILEKPVQILDTELTCALGSAIYAAVSAGLYPSIPEAQKRMAGKVSRVFRPNRDKSLEMRDSYLKYCKLAGYSN